MSEAFSETSEGHSCPKCEATLPPRFATGRLVCGKCGWTNQSKQHPVQGSTQEKAIDLAENLQPQSTGIDPREAQNRERALIVAGTFVIASLFWLSIILPTLSTKPNQTLQAKSVTPSRSLEPDQRVQDQRATPLRSVEPSQQVQGKNAMTWRILDTRTSRDGTPYYLFGSDAQTNPYVGDTDIGQTANLLCIHKVNLPIPPEIPATTITPGGATRGAWSGGQAMVVFDVPGTALSSSAAADKLCNSEGQKFGMTGLRMAEFHDGYQPGGIAGWDFWAEGSQVNLRDKDISTERFWVAINDQAANPWFPKPSQKGLDR